MHTQRYYFGVHHRRSRTATGICGRCRSRFFRRTLQWLQRPAVIKTVSPLRRRPATAHLAVLAAGLLLAMAPPAAASVSALGSRPGPVSAPIALAAATSTAPATAPPPTHPEADYMGSSIRANEPADPPLLSSQALPGGPTQGMDVSSYQQNVDWNTAAANGAQFAYVKASEGTGYLNPFFSSQYGGAYQAGLVRGAYHFALPNQANGTDQANYFINNGGAWIADGRTLPPMLDIEYNPYAGNVCYDLTPGQMSSWIADFSNTVYSRTGRYPMIYSTAAWWNLCTGNNPNFGSTNPLFIANYSTSPGPMPAGWKAQQLWQYNDKGIFPGDQDAFNGSNQELVAFATRAQDTGLTSPNRVAVTNIDGALMAKEGGLFSKWSTVSQSATAVSLDGLRTGVMASDGSALVHDGTLQANPVLEATGAKTISLAGGRVAVLSTDGSVRIKEGNLYSAWTTLWSSGASNVVLDGDRIAVVDHGNVHMKEGSIYSGWTAVASSATDVALSGRRLAVVSGGVAYGKDGSLVASFVALSYASQVAMSGERIGVVNGTSAMVKQGLYGAWVTVADQAVTGLSLTPQRIGVVAQGRIQVKEGGFDARFIDMAAGRAVVLGS